MFFLFFSLFFFWINPKFISPSFSLLVIRVLLFLLVIILGITMSANYFLSSQLGLGPWNTLFFYLTLCCLMSYYAVYIFIYFKSHKMLFLFCAVIFLDLPNICPSHYSQFLPTLLCFHLQSFSFCLKNFSDFFFFFNVQVYGWKILISFINLKASFQYYFWRLFLLGIEF